MVVYNLSAIIFFRLITRIEKWLDISEKYNEKTIVGAVPEAGVDVDVEARNMQWQQSDINMATISDQPDFPLLPASRGFCISMRNTLPAFRAATSS